MSWFSRLANVFRSDRLNHDLDDEIRFHLDARAAEFRRGGMTPVEAAREARRRLGNEWLARETSRDVKLLPWLDSMVRDMRYGWRMLCKSPVVTATAILSLALAIGACTAAYSLIDALILRPLPVRDPAGLVYLTYPAGRPGEPEGDSFNYPLFERLRDATRDQVVLFGISSPRPRDVALGNSTDKIRVQFVSGEALAILGVKPALGRLLTAEDDRHPGESPVAVVSYEFWMRMGGRPDILGQPLDLTDSSSAAAVRIKNTKRLQIVGVAQSGFAGVEPGFKTDAWIPNMMFSPDAFTNANWEWFRVLGRPKPGVTPEQAQHLVQQAFMNYRHDHPRDFRKQINIRSAANGPSRIRKTFERPLWILAIVAGLVLLIAGSNVANLLVARSAARQREMALRISIGAGRGRLLQQLLIESGLLAGVACLLGIAFAKAMGPAVVSRLLAAGETAYLDLSLNWRTLGLVALIGASATALVGLIPAFRSSSVSPGDMLKSGSDRHSARRGLLRPLVAAQVAFSFTVLFTGGLLLLSFYTLSTLDLGLFRSGIVFFDLDGLGERGQPAALQLLDRVRRFPEVQAAAYSTWALLNDNRWISDVKIPGRTDSGKTYQLAVSPGFFDTVGIRLLDGRDFAVRDLDPKASAAVVNEAFARRFFPAQSVLGKQFDRNGDLLEIVGVVHDAKYDEIRGAPPPTAYVPLRGRGGATLSVRAADAERIAPLLRQEILRADRSVNVSRVMLQTTLIDNFLIRDRLLALLAGFFDMVALLLTAIGLYGVLSYSVVQRTKEIGIRMALGARPFLMIRLLISEIALVVALGVVAGMAGGFGLGRYVTSLLYEVKPGNSATIVFPLLGLMLGCLFAALPPALRAMRLNPVVALRQE
jgi:putative ABC transport system permease protein